MQRVKMKMGGVFQELGSVFAIGTFNSPAIE